MSEAQRPRRTNDWWQPLHAGELQAASARTTGLLTLEDIGNYRATCRRCRDEVPLRQCIQPASELLPYIEEFRQQRERPDDRMDWFQTEPGCWFLIETSCFVRAFQTNDIPALVAIYKEEQINICYFKMTVEMVEALHEAGVDLTPRIARLVHFAPVPVVVAALDLQGIDINMVGKCGGSLLKIAVCRGDIDRVTMILDRNADTTIVHHGETPLQFAQSFLSISQASLQANLQDQLLQQRVAGYTQIVALLTNTM